MRALLLLSISFLLSNTIIGQQYPANASYGTGCEEDCNLLNRFDADLFGKFRIPVKFFYSVSNTGINTSNFDAALDEVNEIYAYNGAPFEFYKADAHAIYNIDQSLCAYPLSSNCDCDDVGYGAYEDLIAMSNFCNNHPNSINFFLFEEYYQVNDDNGCGVTTNIPAFANYPIYSSSLASNYIVAENYLINDFEGHVLAHEIGHLLGLYHPFDSLSTSSVIGASSTCVNYDRILDTPNDSNPNTTYDFNNVMEYGLVSQITTPHPLFTQCQRSKMIDVIYDQRKDFCFAPGTPESLILSNGIIPTSSFILGETVFADCELSSVHASNTGGAAVYSIFTPAGDRVSFDFTKTLNLATGTGTPFDVAGTYEICVKDVYPFNPSCFSGELCQNFTLAGGSTGPSIIFTDACNGSHPVTTYFSDIFFHDMQTGWACGSGGIIFKTTDGGSTWTEKYDDTGGEINRIHFFDNMEGVAMRNGGGDILKTYDGGETWASVASLSGNIRDMEFDDSGIGYASGYASGGGNIGAAVYKSNDKGETWSEVMRQNDYQLMHDIKVIDADHIWTVGTLAKVYYSADGGATWDLIDIGSSSTLYAVEFPDINTGMIGDGSGRIRKTTDGGATWTQITTSGPSILQMTFFDQNLGYRVNNSSVKFQVTTDGGVNWTQVTITNPPGVYNSLRRSYFLSPDIGWGVGFSKCHIVKILNLGYEPCPGPGIALSDEHNANRMFEDHSTINSDATIQTGFNVTYSSTQGVELKPGFFSGNNTVFEVMVEGCD